jgi:hypothetical protein
MTTAFKAGTAYTLVGDTLFNGAQDTDGGIWVRIKDENDRRILGAAVDKQLKNQQAAQGTLTALDPNATHLVDYVAAALDRVKSAINGARPVGAQLDGTPLGEAMKHGETKHTGAAADGAGKKTRGGRKSAARGGEPEKAGDVIASNADVVAGINWSDDVPTPRPASGDVLKTPEGHVSSIVTPIGYDVEKQAFRIMDADGWDGDVVAHPSKPGEWRVMSRLLDYADESADIGNLADGVDLADETRADDDAASAVRTNDDAERAVDDSVAATPVDGEPVSTERAEADAAHAADEAGDVPTSGAKTAAKKTAAKKAASSGGANKSQRERNAAHNGVKRGTAAKTTTPKKKR